MTHASLKRLLVIQILRCSVIKAQIFRPFSVASTLGKPTSEQTQRAKGKTTPKNKNLKQKRKMTQIYSNGLRIAVEGCGHGTLDAIYASVNQACLANDYKVDLLIICGDFQAVRNAADLNTMSVPQKYRAMGDFYKYYNLSKKAPYPTIIVGGNHEASSHLWELFHGGWVCPNIYYLGCGGVVNVGGVRIAGLSGIYSAPDYNKPLFERLPYTPGTMRSIYHVRAYNVLKMFQLSGAVDVFVSHDWPNGIEQYGDVQGLLNFKKHFTAEVKSNTLGSPPLMSVLQKLKPRYWFSAHMHVKFSALFRHKGANDEQPNGIDRNVANTNPDELDIDLSDEGDSHSKTEQAEVKNNAEIDLDLDDDEIVPVTGPSEVRNEEEIDLDMDQDENNAIENHNTESSVTNDGAKASDTSSEQPDSADTGNAKNDGASIDKIVSPIYPQEMTRNTETRFLSLDKCLPGRNFLQILEIPVEGLSSRTSDNKVALCYDLEWLAITRVFNKIMPTSFQQHYSEEIKQLGSNDQELIRRINEELVWVQENIVKKGLSKIPENFQQTAAPQDDKAMNMRNQRKFAPWYISACLTRKLKEYAAPQYDNPQTDAFCKLLEIENKISKEYKWN